MHTSFHFFGQNQFTVAERAETTVAECSLTGCVGPRFPDGFQQYVLKHTNHVKCRTHGNYSRRHVNESICVNTIYHFFMFMKW